jgi:hypothetical protein
MVRISGRFCLTVDAGEVIVGKGRPAMKVAPAC